MASVPLMLRLPDDVDGIGPRLLADASKSGQSVQSVILQIVSDYYSVEFAPPVRGRPPKAVDDDSE